MSMCTVLKATHAETSAQEDYEATDLVLGQGLYLHPQ